MLIAGPHTILTFHRNTWVFLLEQVDPFQRIDVALIIPPPAKADGFTAVVRIHGCDVIAMRA